jgi:hypothetical protein
MIPRSLFAAALLLMSLHGWATPFEVSAERSHEETVTGSGDHTFAITVGGTADTSNTAARTHGNWAIGFQNNVSLTIANTGRETLRSPQVVINGERDWRTSEEMLAAFTEGAETDQDRIYLIYDGVRRNRHHDYPLFGDNEYHDPIKFLHVYGGGFCDDSGKIGSALYDLAGFNGANGGEDPFVRALHGHMMCEVWHDGAYQWMDIDQDTFFLDRENRKPVSGDMAAHDHDYAHREQVYGPIFQDWSAGPYSSAALFGRDDERAPKGGWGHTLDYDLRPGEAITFRYENMQGKGKYPYRGDGIEHRYYGNSTLSYNVTARNARATSEAYAQGLDWTGERIVVTEAEARVAVPVASAYTICGGMLHFTLHGAPTGSRVAVEVSRDGTNYVTAVEQPVASDGEFYTQHIGLDEALRVADGAACREYVVRLRLIDARGAYLEALRVESELYTYPIGLPRLRVGENRIVYRDMNEGDRQADLSFEWRESENVSPPPTLAEPVSPQPDAALHETYTEFAWPEVPGADAYHLQVSRFADFRYTYRPNYDLIVPGNRFHVPYRGMFTPDDTFYWRVRARDASGLWGGWSPAWAFTWDGPMVPRDVAVEAAENGDLWLTWTPNPAGTEAAKYRVYGSNVKGFSVNTPGLSMEALAAHVPETLLGETNEMRLLVGGPNAQGEHANRAYYRVIAVDADGVESCPSDYAELPRPHVYSAPVTTATVGADYAYAMELVQSQGDIQHRYDAPGNDYWEREAYTLELVEAPAWMTLDAETNTLHGTPAPEDVGEHAVVVHLATTYPDEVPADATQASRFRNDDPVREGDHRFVITVEPAPESP